MVGLRWVGCCALLTLACGRTSSSDRHAASGGSSSGGGSNSGAAADGGSGAVLAEAGEAGAPECPVTPATGEWAARGPDPYGFELSSDGSHLTGIGCLGGLPSQGDAFGCSPLTVEADSGRKLAFTWDMKPADEFGGIGYVVKMALTLAPDRTAMAGTVWTSLAGSFDDEGQDIVVVRYRDQPPPPPATACSEGEPSGACFLAPLRSDRVDQLRVVELGDGNLLLLWLNNRGIGSRVAVARFDAEAGTWQAAEFLDDGTAPVEAPMLAANADGWAIAAYRQNGAVYARVYDPEGGSWSKQQAVSAEDPSVTLLPKALFVYAGGDATLIEAAQKQDGSYTTWGHSYSAAQGVWQAAEAINDAPGNFNYEWAAASDSARNALVVWVRGGNIGEPYELWFSRRTAAQSWTDPALFYAGDKQILKPAAAFGADGSVIVTWQEFLERVASDAYSFESGTWSEPLTVTSEQDADNRIVTFNDAGAAVAYFHRNNVFSGDADQKSELGSNGWGVPKAVSEEEANGALFSVTGGRDGLEVSRLQPRPGESAPPPFERPRCEGY